MSISDDNVATVSSLDRQGYLPAISLLQVGSVSEVGVNGFGEAVFTTV